MKEKVVVTGGAGFIGSHLAERLQKDGYDVTVIDNLETGRIENIKPFLENITFIEGSILDDNLLKKALRGASVVFHQAAIPSIPKSIKHPRKTNAANVHGTLNVFATALQEGVKRVVFASSSSPYGDSKELPKVETMEYNPLSPYAAQKMLGEVYGKLYHNIFGLETVGLRYFNIFGPKQNPNSDYAAVIPKFITIIKNGKRPTIFGDGETTRDFTYIDNAVQANIQAMSAPNVGGEVFNIACGKRFSLNTLVEEINNYCGTSIKPKYEDFKTGDIKHSLADTKKAKKYLGFKPSIDFREGLRKTFDSLN